MKIFKLLAISVCAFVSVHGQSELMSENPGLKEGKPEKGPNLKHYTNSYFGLGLYDATKDGFADFTFGKSNEIVFGQRYKRKVSEMYSIGTTFEFAISNFHVNPDSSVIFNPTKELIRTNNLGLGLYNRFNFGKRGNQIGKYFEFGAYAQWAMNVKHIYHQEDNIAGKELRSKVVNPDFVDRINYGVNASLGFNRFALTFRYRLSDLLDKTSPYQNAPSMVLGLQIGIHK